MTTSNDKMVVPESELTTRPIDDITYFFIHHSVASPETDIEVLAQMDIQSQGFVTVGYNCVATKKPTGWVIQEGRPIDTLPAAQYGMNQQGYAMCIGGNYEPNVAGVPTNEVEQESLDLAVEQIKLVKSKCPNLKYLAGHRDVAAIMKAQGLNPGNYSTECPGDLLYAKLDYLREQTELLAPPHQEG